MHSTQYSHEPFKMYTYPVLILGSTSIPQLIYAAHSMKVACLFYTIVLLLWTAVAIHSLYSMKEECSVPMMQFLHYCSAVVCFVVCSSYSPTCSLHMAQHPRFLLSMVHHSSAVRSQIPCHKHLLTQHNLSRNVVKGSATKLEIQEQIPRPPQLAVKGSTTNQLLKSQQPLPPYHPSLSSSSPMD